jgi:hypothetical protein
VLNSCFAGIIMDREFMIQKNIAFLILLGIIVIFVFIFNMLFSAHSALSTSVFFSGADDQWSSNIAVTKSFFDPEERSFVVRLLNTGSESITIKELNVGGKIVSFFDYLPQGHSGSFKVEMDSKCTQGKVISKDLIITFLTQSGLIKKEKYPIEIVFDCNPVKFSHIKLASRCQVCPSSFTGTAASGSVLSGFTFYSGSSVLQSGGLKLYANLGTGQTSCSNGSSVQVCPVSGFPGQDAERYGSSFVHSWGSATAGTILDLNSGLRWQIADNGSAVNWQSALQYCDSLSLDGYTDWYLPTRSEIWQTYDYQTGTCNSVFSSCRDYYYWTSTSVIAIPSNAFMLDIQTGIDYYGAKVIASQRYARCVRFEN